MFPSQSRIEKKWAQEKDLWVLNKQGVEKPIRFTLNNCPGEKESIRTEESVEEAFSRFTIHIQMWQCQSCPLHDCLTSACHKLLYRLCANPTILSSCYQCNSFHSSASLGPVGREMQSWYAPQHHFTSITKRVSYRCFVWTNIEFIICIIICIWIQ